MTFTSDSTLAISRPTIRAYDDGTTGGFSSFPRTPAFGSSHKIVFKACTSSSSCCAPVSVNFLHRNTAPYVPGAMDPASFSQKNKK